MFDMLQPGDHTNNNDLADYESFGGFDDFEGFEEFERLAEIIQFTQQAIPTPAHNPVQAARELDTVPPGVHLAAMVDQVNVTKVSGHEQIAVLRAHQRLASHHQAHVYRAMAAVVTTMEDEFDDVESQVHAATAETRVALRLTRRAAETELHMALELTRRLPAVIDALDAGLIDNRRARAIVHGTTHLPDDTARTEVDAIIDDAPQVHHRSTRRPATETLYRRRPRPRHQTLPTSRRATQHHHPTNQRRHHQPVRHRFAT